MSRLDEVFSGCIISNKDSFVADYTNDADKEVAKRGVEITTVDPGYEHGCFHLVNPNGIPYYSVNFEHNTSFFKDNNGKILRNCECMFSSCYAKKKKWALLLEMKYCREKNIQANAEDALDELEKTRDRLIEKGVLKSEEYRLYFDISFPEHTSKEPFTSFLFSQDELLKYKQSTGVNFLGNNNTLIANGAYLRI